MTFTGSQMSTLARLVMLKPHTNTYIHNINNFSFLTLVDINSHSKGSSQSDMYTGPRWVSCYVWYTTLFGTLQGTFQGHSSPYHTLQNNDQRPVYLIHTSIKLHSKDSDLESTGRWTLCVNISSLRIFLIISTEVTYDWKQDVQDWHNEVQLHYRLQNKRQWI